MEENKGLTAGAMNTLQEMVEVIESHAEIVKALPEDQLSNVIKQLGKEGSLIEQEIIKVEQSASEDYRGLRLSYLRGQKTFILTLLNIAEASYSRRFMN